MTDVPTQLQLDDLRGQMVSLRRARRSSRLAIVLGAMALVAVTATATNYVIAAASTPTPGTIPYRGVLKQNGVPVPTGTVQMVFSLYDQQAPGGNLVWGPETQSVAVADGSFGVELGKSIGKPTDAQMQSASLWLDVSVAGQSLTPRQQLLSAPYARRADFAANGVPAGTILPFGGTSNTVPEGYLLCDGSSVLQAQYPGLFAAIGTSWGSADATHFNVPDLRGVFLRGVDGSRGLDSDRATRGSSSPGGAVGNAVGSFESWATALPHNAFTTDVGGSHTHSYVTTSLYLDNHFNNPGGMMRFGDPSTFLTSDAGAHSHAITGGGDLESRPVNAAVNYIIRI